MRPFICYTSGSTSSVVFVYELEIVQRAEQFGGIMSRAYMRYRKEVRTEPCGTPESGLNGPDWALPTLTVIMLSVRYKCISLEMLRGRPLFMSFLTWLKAF